MRPLHIETTRPNRQHAHQARDAVSSWELLSSNYLSDSQRFAIADASAKELEVLTDRHFPRTQNLEYAILKSHIIIEFAITEFVRCNATVLVDRSKMQFSFSQKLEIAIYKGFGAACPTTIPSYELLNQVRNQVAHRFEFDRNVLNELIVINSDEVDPSEFTDRQRIAFLRNFCAFTCGYIAGAIKAAVIVTEKA